MLLGSREREGRASGLPSMDDVGLLHQRVGGHMWLLALEGAVLYRTRDLYAHDGTGRDGSLYDERAERRGKHANTPTKTFNTTVVISKWVCIEYQPEGTVRSNRAATVQCLYHE